MKTTTKAAGIAGRGALPADGSSAKDEGMEAFFNDAPGQLMRLGMAAMHGRPERIRDEARNLSRAAVALLGRLGRALDDEVYARHAGHVRWDLRCTRIVVHHPRPGQPTAPREIYVDVGPDVELAAADRARLRDALRVVAGVVLGAPARGQRTGVTVRTADRGIPALDRALGSGPEADALWRSLVADVTRRVRASRRAGRRTRRAR